MNAALPSTPSPTPRRTRCSRSTRRADGTLTPATATSRAAPVRGAAGPAHRARSHRARLAARGQRRLERGRRRSDPPRPPRAREPRALRRHHAEQRPIHDGIAYVLNAGGSGSISGFTLSRRGLARLAGSTQALSSATAGAVHILHAARRPHVVSGEGCQHHRDLPDRSLPGRASAGTAHASAGAAPFGFSFGEHEALNVTEAGASALSSYALTPFPRSPRRS